MPRGGAAGISKDDAMLLAKFIQNVPVIEKPAAVPAPQGLSGGGFVEGGLSEKPDGALLLADLSEIVEDEIKKLVV